jgi:hypothetical protein
MEPTKEEYNKIYKRTLDRFRNRNEVYTDESIEQIVNKHFSNFLNKSEQQAIEEVIIQNFKENNGYTDGLLPNGNRLCWEIQIIACKWADTDVRKNHMEKWYTQYYTNQIANIIKSKRL